MDVIFFILMFLFILSQSILSDPIWPEATTFMSFLHILQKAWEDPSLYTSSVSLFFINIKILKIVMHLYSEL